MLQGVHADTIIFADYHHTRSSLLGGGSLLSQSGREIELQGTPPRRFRVRARALREVGKAFSWELQLHEGRYGSAPVMTVDLTFAPYAANTKVTLRGTTARNLSPASATQDERSRRLANQYARALLDRIAGGIEAWSPTTTPPSSPATSPIRLTKNASNRAKSSKSAV